MKDYSYRKQKLGNRIECNVVGCHILLPNKGKVWRVCVQHKYLMQYDVDQLKEMGIRFKDEMYKEEALEMIEGQLSPFPEDETGRDLEAAWNYIKENLK